MPAQGAAPGVFRAESFTLGYGQPQENVIPLDELRDIKVNIELRDGVYYAAPAPAKKSPPPAYTVGQAYPEGKFSESALVEIFQSIAKYYNARGIYGVFVVVNRDDIDPQTHEDYRPADRKDLRLTIWVSRVGELRTIAKGMRIVNIDLQSGMGAGPVNLDGENPRAKSNETINNPVHRLIAKYSPLQPDPNIVGPKSLLIKSRLDNYLLDLNRHPARRVDAAISAGATPGEVTVDYLVSEKRPWFAYAQISDSGTDETNDLRAHVGFSYYQLTNRDDTLLLDASSSTDFEAGYSASASYNRPLLYPNTLRAKIFAAYSEFTADDVAIALDEFTGNSIATGLELPWSPFRLWGISVDIVPGVVWQKYRVDNTSISLRATTDFVAAMLGIRLERNTDTMRTYLRVGYETNFDGDTSMSALDIATLGRLEATPDYQIVNLDFAHTMYIEPLLFGEKFYSGDNWRKSARAHEILISARAQRVVGNQRLIPQKMMTLGGMYSVRGYPEATISGDNVCMGTFEYRLHVPRLFRPYSALPRDRGDYTPSSYFGVPFNWRAPGLHTLPDWDFIVRLFGDLGRAEIINILPWESSHTLASIGFGVEAQLKGILNIRVDWGFAQKTVRTTGRYVPNNSSQVHFTASVLW